MSRIAVIPPWPGLHNRNRLFGLPGFAEWWARGAAAGYEIGTADVITPESADCVWVIDVARPHELAAPLAAVRRRGGRAVLQILESPLVRPHSWNRSMHRQFDRVLTYEQAAGSDALYRHYRIPVRLRSALSGIPFQARRISVMLNTNHLKGFWEKRSRTEPLLHFLGGRLSAALRPVRGDLYGWRRRLARTAETLPAGTLDVYGRDWQGQQLSWCAMYPHRAYRCATEAPIHAEGLGGWTRKIALLGGYRFAIAAENYRGHRDYISEKIIDPLLAGTVPVYLGEDHITRVIPENAFVDARKYRSQAELLHFLRECPAQQWQAMQRAGQAWLASPQAAEFRGEAFADLAMNVLKELLA